ncbi:ABC transporter substrate-binding protein [Cohnella zeiphila]|uniref:Sugar ABC transporter substrate-binding protein n=1 Tax=Cohnella zeiphila TaxID=2761120 RepID=A0A7X0VX09_9BACL|nr:sugar ABC transporter substrate-binding protein [Cohnella zeiphila]MBB6731453.1 sugar ABC transporter substrate-binding protein [Cohnella zeiphila]
MQKKKALWTGLVLLLAAALTAACSDGSPSESSSGSSGGSKGKVTISMAYTGDQNALDTLKKRLNQYLDPSLNISVDVTLIPGGEYWDKVSTMFAGGTPPDVLFMSEPFKQYAKQSSLLDLTSYIEASPTFNRDDFYPASLEFYQYNGKQFGVPQDLNTWVIFYNEDLFKEAGVKTPWEYYQEGDWTWDNYLDVAKKLTKISGDRVTQYGTGYPAIAGWSYSAWVFAGGGNYKSADGKTSTMSDPKTLAAFQFTTGLANQYEVAPMPATGGGTNITGMTFATGKVAMEANGSWSIGGYKDMKFKWNIAPMPVVPGVDPLTSYIHNSGFAISASTKHPQEAWAVLEALVKPESYADDAASRGIIPPRPSVVASEKILNAPGMPSNASVISDMLAKGKLFPFDETYAEEEKVYTDIGNEILTKKVTPEDGAAEMDRKVNEILAKQ